MEKVKIITIDGPASSGKGTIAKIIAKKLGFNYLDSGAIYRVIGLIAKQNNLTDKDLDKLVELTKSSTLKFDGDKISLNGEDVSLSIREEEVGMLASSFGAISIIRKSVLDLQRSFAILPGLVTDGRDMGSVIFPDADLKVFLTASAEERANRRVRQLHMMDRPDIISSVLKDILVRDKQDMERDIAPLGYDSSFMLLDNSKLSVDDTVNQIIDWFNKKH